MFCYDPPQIDNNASIVEVINPASHPSVYQEGTTLYIECNEGYRVAGLEDNIRVVSIKSTCQATGDFDVQHVLCEGIVY